MCCLEIKSFLFRACQALKVSDFLFVCFLKLQSTVLHLNKILTTRDFQFKVIVFLNLAALSKIKKILNLISNPLFMPGLFPTKVKIVL